MSKIYELFGLEGHVNPQDQLFGVELEIESYMGLKAKVSNWVQDADGSLRNHGVEFISKPMTIPALVAGFQDIHAKFIDEPNLPRFSERTSIHVHANCQNLTEEEVLSILRWYVVMEEEFFKKVAPSRRHNIHCVPLSDTFLNSYYRSGVHTLSQRWSKYTALNLLPLRKLGTMEFRHMEGHDDPARFAEWLSIIRALFDWGRANPFTASSLQTSELQKGYQAVFQKPFNETQFSRDNFNGIVDMKLAFLG